MEPVPDVNPPPLVYERYLCDVQEVTENSLNSFRNWCQQTFKYISDKVQALDNNMAKEHSEVVRLAEGMAACRVPRAQPRLEALEVRVFGQPSGTHVPGSTGGLLARVAALETTCEDVDFPRIATHFDDKYDAAFTRIRFLERKMKALEMKVEPPVADRTRYRKQPRRPSPP